MGSYGNDGECGEYAGFGSASDVGGVGGCKGKPPVSDTAGDCWETGAVEGGGGTAPGVEPDGMAPVLVWGWGGTAPAGGIGGTAPVRVWGQAVSV